MAGYSLALDALNAGPAGIISLKGMVSGGSTTGAFSIDGASTVNINQNIDAKSITIKNVTTGVVDVPSVNIAKDVDLTAEDGRIQIWDNVAGIKLLGGDTDGTNEIKAYGDYGSTPSDPAAALLYLANITYDTGKSPNLFIQSDADVTVGTVDVNSGILKIYFDNNDNDLGTANTSPRTLLAEALSAKVRWLEGGADGNDIIKVGSILSHEPLVFNDNVVLTQHTSYKTVDGIFNITFDKGVYTDGNGAWDLTLDSTGKTYFDGDVGNNGAGTELGDLTVYAAGGITIAGSVINANTINLGSAVTFNNALGLTLSAANDITFGSTVTGTGTGALDLTADTIKLYNNITTNGGGMTFTGPVTLYHDVIMDTGSIADETITLINNVNGQGVYDLTLLAGNIAVPGTATLTGIVDLSMTASSDTASLGTSNDPIDTGISGTLTALAPNSTVGVYIKNTGSLNVASINAGTGNVGLDATGKITDTAGNDTTTDITGNELTISASGVGTSASDALNLNVDNIVSITSSNAVFLTEANDVDLGDIDVSGSTLYIKAGGSLTDTDNNSALTSNDMTLTATLGGIGTINDHINTKTTGTSGTILSLTSGGAGSAGDINIYETNGINTSNLAFSTTGSGTQTVSLSFGGDITTGAAIGNSADNLTLTSRTGSILDGGGLITAKDLALIVEGLDASIGEPWDETTGVTTIEKYKIDPDTSTPVLIRVYGTLTADASNGTGGIFLKVPKVDITASQGTAEYTNQYKENSVTFASIDAGEGGNIGITLTGSLNGIVVPKGYNEETFLPVYEYGDYAAWRNGGTLDNVISGNDLIITADTMGLTNPPQLDVANIIAVLSDTGAHPAYAIDKKAGGDFSAVLSVEDPDPDAETPGGRLTEENYPPDPLVSFPKRPGIVQIGIYQIDPDANILGLLSSSALVVISPQQEALEKLLASSGGEDFFMSPPIWIDIEMEEEEEKKEEEEEFTDEFTFLQSPYLFGTPDLNNVKDMPSLLGQEVEEELLKLSFLVEEDIRQDKQDRQD